MPKISHYDAHGKRFNFEPPVEVGDHSVDSLAKLATLAASGPDIDARMLTILTEANKNSLSVVFAHSGVEGFPDALTRLANVRDADYTITAD